MKIGAIIQARMSSTRLPGKVLKELPYGSGISTIEQIATRLKHSQKINQIIVATSDKQDDEKIVRLCKSKKIDIYAGDLNNVLDRFYNAAKQFSLDLILRITGDCPAVDYTIIDKLIGDHIDGGYDFSTLSGIKRTFPIGIDASVFSFELLKEAHSFAVHDYEKEHVTSYFYKSHPEKFSILSFEAPFHYNFPELRLTLDTPEDYIFLCAIYDFLHEKNPLFSLDDILALINSKPWIIEINKSVVQKKTHENFDEEIKELISYSRKQDLKRVLPELKKLIKQDL